MAGQIIPRIKRRSCPFDPGFRLNGLPPVSPPGELGRQPFRFEVSPFLERSHAMELTESYTLPLPPQRVWEALFDADNLCASIPGCERIESLGDNAFLLAMSVSFDGVKTDFKGRMRLSVIEASRACTLLLEVESGGTSGGAHKAALRLEADGDAPTTLLYTAHVHTDATDGAGTASAAVHKVASEFFKRFAAQLTALGNGLPIDAPQPAEPSLQRAAAAESAFSGRGQKSWRYWTSSRS
ncbi:MAG TPA: SRPBCC domain-containing protein [Trinickia sp.]|nr:SRPBCC domain-containing protein [Trinickia sp.]